MVGYTVAYPTSVPSGPPVTTISMDSVSPHKPTAEKHNTKIEQTVIWKQTSEKIRPLEKNNALFIFIPFSFSRPHFAERRLTHSVRKTLLILTVCVEKSRFFFE